MHNNLATSERNFQEFFNSFARSQEKEKNLNKIRSI